ncbi:hypothetical protein BH11MYX3_BH11MYX3_24420 [soil metagenome]
MSRPSAIVAALIALVIPACRYVLDEPFEPGARSCKEGTVAACVEAPMHSNLAWIEQNVFNKCTFSGCHNGAMTDAGRLDMTPGKSHAAMVDVDSEIAAGPLLSGKAKIVTPGDPARSYLLVMLRQITPAEHDPPLDDPPSSVGYMPQNAGGAVTCCQKLDAVQRWIEAGALDN